jgi:hypothetical protein
MGDTETLPDSTTVASGLFIKSADFLTTNAALKGAFVGRNSSGVPASGQSLGTLLFPWGNLYTNALTINGVAIDTSQIVSPANRIVSGKTRTTSGQPQFIQANGAAATATVLGASTNLVLSINSAAVTVSTDIDETGLTVAPSSNNTCVINDASFTDQPESKYYGEVDSEVPIITIDTVGSEISGRVGQFIALKTSSSEIMFGWLKSATEFTNVKRGLFFDSSLNPIVRETLADDDVLTLLETGWIFVEDDGATLDVTYLTPVYAYDAPGSPATGQYWYDIANLTWKRWSGSAFVDVGRMLIGICVQNTSNCIASRSFDFYKDFKEENTIQVEVFSDTIVRSVYRSNSVNVYGTGLAIENYPVQWDNTANMETGGVAADTTYYCYLSTEGEPYISTERPYDRTGDLRGKYHPYNNWRYIFRAVTDGSSDWLIVKSSDACSIKVTPSANFESKNLKLGETLTNTTISGSFDSLSLLNADYIPKFLFNKSITWDTAKHLQGPELASTYYGLWVDEFIRLKLVPDLVGTTTGTTASKLVDSGATFVTYGVQKGDIVYNTTDGTQTTVLAVDSETTLSLVDDFFTTTEDYKIVILTPVGLSAHAERVGKVYNDGSSNFTNSYYTQIQEKKKYIGAASGGDFLVSGQAGFTVVDIFAIVEQVGTEWVIDVTYDFTQTAGGAATITLTGVTFKTGTTQSGTMLECAGQNAAYPYNKNIVSGGNGIITIETAASTVVVRGRIKAFLDSKPTFHI